MKKLLLFSCSIFILIFFGCHSKRNENASQPVSRDVVEVMVHSVQPGAFTEFGWYEGRIIPINEVKLVCYNGGRVEALRVKEGDFVKAGISLAAIDSAKAITQLKTAQLQEKIATMSLEQTRKHLKDGNASPLSVDKAELELLIARNNRIEAQKNYRGALAITPLAGMVTLRSISLYQEIAPGSQTFTISQTGAMNVAISIVQSEAPLIALGSNAKIKSSLYPDRTWSGVVKSIAREASDHAFRADVYLDNTDGLLKSGAAAKVKIELRRHNDAILIPTRCIRSEGSEYSVMVVTDDNHASRRIVIPGSPTDSLTFIKSGLEKGDRVITTRYDLMRDGLQVRIVGR